RAAAGLVQDGFTIALDGSTTTYAMLAALKQPERLEKLIVVTNSLMIAHSLLDSPHIQVWMPGGWLRRDSTTLVGRPETLPDINVNLGFFGARGVTLATGFTESDGDEATTKRALLTRCARAVLLIGPEKWGKIAPYTFAGPEEVEAVLTTEAAPPPLVAQFRALGVAVETLRIPAG
ncbi:MAG: DeoR/GlpR transcriptional regulator, partial [Anaerolineae bacterium]|nr:DeoR/GlpR transcriptional regulator [Anaerolineae bacterium]